MSDEKQPDSYLKQLADEADWAGTYLSGVSGTSSGPQHVDGDRISKLVQASKNLLEACYRADSIEELSGEIDGSLLDALGSVLRAMAEDEAYAVDSAPPSPAQSGLPQNTSGDGSESAGLQGDCADCDKLIGERDEMEERVNRIVAALGIQEPDSDWSNLNDPSERAIEKIETLLTALAPAISRPPTQGAPQGNFNENKTVFLARDGSEHSVPIDEPIAQPPSLPPSRVELGGDRPEQLARWMTEHSFATGHGDSFEDLLKELSWQVKELRARMEK